MTHRAMAAAWMVGVGICWGILWAEGEQSAVSEERIAQLITQLGSETFAEREQATKALEAIGEPALPALREAAEKSSDAEIKRRASDLVRVIEARLATEKLRRPTLLSVAYHNTPLPDVLQDLKAKSGLPFELPLSAERLAHLRQKLVTLRFDQKPFWEVVDQVLAASGLRQAEPQNFDQRQIFILEEGQVDKHRVCYSGVARIRWLSRSLSRTQPGAPAGQEREVFSLEICLEPQRFIAEGAPTFAEVQVLDEKGQPVRANAQALPTETSQQEGKQPEDGIIVLPAQGGVQIVGQVQVQLNARIIGPGVRPREPRWKLLTNLPVDKAALQKAAAIRGQIDLKVLTREEVVIPNPLKAERRTYGDANGFAIRLVEAQQNNRIVKIVLESPQMFQPNLGPIIANPGLINNQDFLLFDENQQPCLLVGRSLNVNVVGNQVTHQIILSFQLPKNESRPTRLSVAAHVPNNLTLPFQFSLVAR